MGDENKQFEASQQKLRKAREQGQVVKSKDLIKGNKYCTLSMLQHLGYYKYIDYNYDGDNTTVNMCDKGYDYINNAKARFVTNSLSIVAIIVSIVAICRT